MEIVASQSSRILSCEMKSAHLNETGVDQDASANCVHNTTDGRSGRSPRVVRRPDAQPRGDANRGSKTVQESSSDGDPVIFLVKLEEGETGTNPETLKCFFRLSELRRRN